MADEGLTFHPSPYDPPLGYAGFDVELGDAPSARYFDARRLSFPVEEDGVLKRESVEHPWNQSPTLRLNSAIKPSCSTVSSPAWPIRRMSSSQISSGHWSGL